LATLHRSYETVPVRAAVRFPLRLEIVLRTIERQYPAVTEDVSANGLLFAAGDRNMVGDVVGHVLEDYYLPPRTCRR
jgi:hypothetical protein